MHWIDPACLPANKGTVDRFLLSPHGEADGLLLTEGTEVHFPTHMAKRVLAALRPGDTVTVRGLRPRGTDMLVAVSLQAGDAAPIVDEGRGKHHHDHHKDGEHKAEKHAESFERASTDLEGMVRKVLHGPRGEPRGALMEDGCIVRMPPHAAEALHSKLAAGHKLAARGESLTNALGTVLLAEEVGVSLAALHPVDPKKAARQHERAGRHAPPM